MIGYNFRERARRDAPSARPQLIAVGGTAVRYQETGRSRGKVVIIME